MKRLNRKIGLLVTALLILSLGLCIRSDTLAVVEEEAIENKASEHPKMAEVVKTDGLSMPDGEKKTPEFAPDQLIVKLKEGKAMDDLKELNAKYGIISTSRVFAETPDSKESLEGLRKKLSGLESKEHQGWYWQMDKDSQEYKDYAARIEKEKEELKKQIQSQEELAAHLAQRQKRAPEGAASPNLENVYLLKTASGADILAMAAEYKANPNVEYAQPDYKNKLYMVPNDPYYASTNSWGQGYDDLWGLKKMQVEEAWDISQGEGVVVAVIDTGVDYNHEDIAANMWNNAGEIPNNNIDDDYNGYIDDIRGWDFIGADANNPVLDSDPQDGHGHGTHCAGTIAAIGNNARGIIGVAPKAKVMAVKGLDDNGSGYDSNLADALRYAADNGADVVSNSWGGSGSSQVIEDVVNYAYSKGCVIVAAAGNNNADVANFFPANIPNVIAVASSDHNDQKSDFSNWGSKIDVAAPGGDSANGSSNTDYRNILSLRSSGTDIYGDGSCIVGTNYYRLRGTSMACPHVSGVAALILGNKPSFTNSDVYNTLRTSADDTNAQGFDIESGFGRVNAFKAVQQNPMQLLRIIYAQASEIQGDRNMEINPGETARVNAEVQNLWLPASNIQIEILSTDTSITLLQNQISLGPMASGEIMPISFECTISSDAVAPKALAFSARISDSGGFDKEFPFTAGYVIPFIKNPFPLQAGWPVKFNSWYKIADPPTIADIDKDGKPEMIVNDNFNITVLRFDGTVMPGWPQPVGSSIVPRQAAGDIDGDGDLEIFALPMPYQDKKVYAWHHNGQPVAGWPRQLSSDYRLTGVSVPVIADVNGDNAGEIIFSQDVVNEAANYQYYIDVHCLDKNGNELAGWPIRTHTRYPIIFEYGLLPTPVVGDLDGDNKKEIFVSIPQGESGLLQADLFAWHYNGQPVTGWPVNLPSIVNAAVMADIDNDKQEEIVVALGNNTISVLRNNGAIMPGWPTAQLTHAVTYANQGIAVGDIDGDGDLEIVINGYTYIDNAGAVGTVYVWHHNGTLAQGWPQVTMNNLWGDNDPVLGDINGDKKIEVILTVNAGREAYKMGYCDSRLFAWNFDGTLVDGFPKESRDPFLLKPVLADLDKDGEAEVVFSAYAKWYALDFPGKTEHIEWETFAHNAARDGHYSKRVLSLQPSTTDVSLILTKDYSSPSGLTLANAFTITNNGNSGTTWQLYNNQDGTYTPPAGQPTPVPVQGFGFYESSGGIGAHQIAVIRAYVNNNRAAGVYKGSCKLQEINNGTTIDIATIFYTLDVKDDTTAPTTPVVTDDGAYTTATTQLKASWSSADVESGIVEYQYRITQDSISGIVIRDWTSAGVNASVTATGLTLQNGKAYYFGVKARNNAGLWSDIGTSDSITVETTPPTTPVVTDGGAYTTSTTTLSASWASSDPESGITDYRYRITRDTPEGILVQYWTSVGTATSVTATGLNLQPGVTYFFNVVATNGVGLYTKGSSDGIKVETTLPTTPVVTDGGAYTTSTTTLSASWISSDPESGIVEYQYRITQDSTSGTVIRDWTSTGISSSVTAGSLGLLNGKVYFVGVKAKNSSGLWSAEGYSDGITVDNKGPVIVNKTSASQSRKTPLVFKAQVTDNPSGVLRAYLQIKTGNTWSQTLYDMSYSASTGLYSVQRPAQTKPGYIIFRIVADDKTGNRRISAQYTVRVL